MADVIIDERPSSPLITIIGYGSLLSPTSALSTFQHISNYRYCVIKNYERRYGHPSAFFFEMGLVSSTELENKEVCSLDCRPRYGSKFICSVFDIDNTIEEWNKFLKRENEFKIKLIAYYNRENEDELEGYGYICLASTDANYVSIYGADDYNEKIHRMQQYDKDLNSIWKWSCKEDLELKDCRLRPCRWYLRHCILAVTKAGNDIHEDFIENTKLIDGTTLKEYILLIGLDVILNSLPPPALIGRYSG